MGSATLKNGPANRIADATDSAAQSNLLDQAIAATPQHTIYDQISDPLAFIERMGKSFAHAGVAGCKTQAQGECLAWALLEMRKNWVEFASEYHMVDGKPTLQAHAIMARIRKAGGKFKWINDGDDLKEASAEFTIEGQTKVVAYTWTDAVRAKIQGFDNAQSAWQRSPSAMLRAAMSRKAAKMLCPEVLTGDVDPEEFDSPVAAPSPVMQALHRSSAEIEQRRKELEGAVVPATTEMTAASTVESAPFEAQANAEVPPAETIIGDSENDMTVVLLEIEATLSQAGQSKSALETKLGKTLDQLSLDGAKTLLANLRNVIAAKK